MKTGRISLGCVTFGREIDEESSFRILDYAVDHGITSFDTAEAYGAGESERILGRWLRRTGCRKDIFLQTKLSYDYTGEGVREAIARSLERLQTDWIDSYLFHRLDASMPLSDCLRAMRHDAIRNIGCSNVTAPDLVAALATARSEGLPLFASIQPPYNLLQRNIEHDLIPVCRRDNISVVPYSPLAAGFLTGKYTSDRSTVPRGSRFDLVPGHAGVYFSERNFRIVSRLHAFAGQTGVPPLRLAISWVLQNPDIQAVLVGARDVSHLDNALEACRFEMPAAWLEQMNSWQHV